MRIVDPHIHLWNLDTHNYPWLANPGEAFIGDYSSIAVNFLPEHLLSGAGDIEIVKVVHVDANHDPALPVKETEWLQGLADQGGLPQGIVAFADLASPQLASILEQHAAFANVRGIRQILNRHEEAIYNYTEVDYLNDATWCENFKRLEKHNLSFDVQIYPHQAVDSCRLVDQHPNTSFIINHTGMFVDRTLEGFCQWRDGLTELARRDNVFIKISGLGMFDRQWTVESLRPYVLQTIDTFGTKRSMFASNFPVDKLFNSYASLWHAYDQIANGFSDSERKQLFKTNAERVYRI